MVLLLLASLARRQSVVEGATERRDSASSKGRKINSLPNLFVACKNSLTVQNSSLVLLQIVEEPSFACKQTSADAAGRCVGGGCCWSVRREAAAAVNTVPASLFPPIEEKMNIKG